MTEMVDESDDVGESRGLCWDFGPGDLPPLAAIRQRLATWLVDVAAEVIQDLLMVVTELVTNAYEYGRLPGQVRTTRLNRNVIRVEVDDRSPSMPRFQRAPGTNSPRSRGIALVNALARRWGVIRAPWGKTVWAEVTA
jgi:two-component sensor histidine kinase